MDNGIPDLIKVKGAVSEPIHAPPLARSVLQLIWREHRISRAEIARRLKLSRSTVTEIVSDLLGTGFVTEAGRGKSSGGRRPIVLQFEDQVRVVIGIEVGSTHVSVALTDLRGTILEWAERQHPVRTDPDGTLRVIEQMIDACLATRENGGEDLLSIALAIPSPVDPRGRTLLSPEVAESWYGRQDVASLADRYGVPVHVDNDANLGALAERWWGCGRDIDDFIYVKAAYGIGAGFILDGRIYRGAMGLAGEIGHLSIDASGIDCRCGQKGCLVRYAGGRALRQRVLDLAAEFPESPLTGDSLTALVVAAREGDALACRVLEEAGTHLGTALLGVINLINPSAIILGGTLSLGGDLLLDPIRATIKGRALVSGDDDVAVMQSSLDTRAVALGAATLALEAAMSAVDRAEATKSV